MISQLIKKLRATSAGLLFVGGTVFQAAPMDGCNSNITIRIEDGTTGVNSSEETTELEPVGTEEVGLTGFGWIDGGWINIPNVYNPIELPYYGGF